MNKKSTITALSAISMATFAQAQTTITETISFTEVLSTAQTISFGQYSGAPGDLLKAEWSYDLTITGGTFAYDNDGGSPTTVTSELGATLNVDSSTTTLDTSFQQIFSDLDIFNTDTFNLAADDGDTEVGGTPNFSNQGTDYAILTGSTESISGTGEVNSLFLSEYLGTGDIDLGLTSSNILNTVGGTGVQGAFSAVTLDGSITLTYTLVPEPSSALLACTGLIGLLMRRRR